jgi:tetratricopeptide (TPR) repeat protein
MPTRARPAAPAPARDDLPAVAGKSETSKIVDLPASVASGSFHDDLPAPARSKAHEPLAIDLDLPATAGRNLPADLPSPAGQRARPGSPVPNYGVDLPAVGGSSARADLPARVGAGQSPSARKPSEVPLPNLRDSDLPSVALDDESDFAVELPSLGGVELPSAQTKMDLPSLSGGLPAPAAGLPSARTGLELDLDDSVPPPRGHVELPSLAGPALPSLGGASLPSLGGASLPSLGGASLPSPTQAGLPTLGGSSLPAASATGLPAFSASGFPSPSASGLPTQQGAREVPSLPPDFGSSSQPPDPLGADFGSLELGGDAGPPSARPQASPYAAEEADLFGEAPIPMASARSSEPEQTAAAAAAAVVRQSGGGTAYGEVNLGSDAEASELPIEAAAPAARSEEDMEFGAIPQEDKPRASVGPARASLGIARAPSVMPAAPRRRLAPKIFAGLFVVAVGGGALSFVPSLGPFGAYFISDQLKAGEYQALLADTVKGARSALAHDSYPDAARAFSATQAARARAKRLRPLATYAAFTAFLGELRFGADPSAHAQAVVALDALPKDVDVQYLALARAARVAAEGQLAQANTQVTALARQAPNDPDSALLLAEVELRGHDAKAALAAWTQAAALEKSPRTSFGLSRASFLAGDSATAQKLAKETLAQNPSHTGALILLARVDTLSRTGEGDALQTLDGIVKHPQLSSPEEIVLAQTLLGEIQLARSHMSLAEAAFGEALKINPKEAPALIGLGETLYRASRYSEAQARFEAATQADPDNLQAQIGVAKAKLGLERVEEASGLLKKLRDANPQSISVAYWYGRTLEALGNRAQAEVVYRDTLKTAGDDPGSVDVYISLALLLNQSGNPDGAQKVLADARSKLPNLPAIHKALGDVLLSQGRYAEAVHEFQEALSLDAEDLAAKFKLGVALRRDGKYDAAGKVFDDVGGIDAEYPGLALERGLLYEASGRSADALKQYESALAKAPNDTDLMLRVGCAKVAAGGGKQAEELLRKVLSDRPTSAETNHCLGRALLLDGTRVADALHLLERAVELDPNRAEYQLFVGWAANEAGNVPKAEHALAEALRLDRGLADAYWQRGVLRQRQGASKDAIADLTKAIELRPTRFEAHAALADAYFDLGKEQQALSEWQLALAAQPDNATWHFRYGKLLAANNSREQAREQLSKALEFAASTDPPPAWAGEAHRLLAQALGLVPEAVKHWEEFLRLLGPRDSPYRSEAKSSLDKLGHPWSG